jgi:hypothetical protein
MVVQMVSSKVATKAVGLAVWTVVPMVVETAGQSVDSRAVEKADLWAENLKRIRSYFDMLVLYLIIHSSHTVPETSPVPTHIFKKIKRPIT